MTKTKLDYAQKYVDIGQAAADASATFNKLGREVEAHRYLNVSKYCYQRYLNIITPMLTRKTDRTLNVLGAIFSTGIAALIVYLIINKK